MKEIVSDLVKTLNKYSFSVNEPISKGISSLIAESSFVWTKDYTIAIAKDGTKRKVVDFMVSTEECPEDATFSFKREYDFWKKLDSKDCYTAVVECSSFTEEDSLAVIEKEGRNIMRSRKEVPSVATLGFVWIVSIDSSRELDDIFILYFKENYKVLNDGDIKYYIGWSETLKSVNMKNFFSNPKSIY